MVLINLASALAAASMLLAASAQGDSPTQTKKYLETPTTIVPAREMASIGCFETGTPLVQYGQYDFQSPGNCQLICLQEGKNVMGLANGYDCWCGDKIPAKEWQTDNSTCDTECPGTDLVKCTYDMHGTLAHTDVARWWS